MSQDQFEPRINYCPFCSYPGGSIEEMSSHLTTDHENMKDYYAYSSEQLILLKHPGYMINWFCDETYDPDKPEAQWFIKQVRPLSLRYFKIANRVQCIKPQQSLAFVNQVCQSMRNLVLFERVNFYLKWYIDGGKLLNC